MSSTTLVAEFAAYSEWRNRLAQQVGEYRQWLNREDLNDSQRDLRLQQLIDRLAEDKLHVAFIAEFSRGKSELINAIFLSDLKQRLLPSTAGRTTMCPTELLYDPAKPAQIQLLPIETRSTNATVAEYRNYPEEWRIIPIDVASPDSISQAMSEVCRVKPVDTEQARQYGLYDPERPDAGMGLTEDGQVTVPAWRHAVINFPHPFLEKGLVVYDTPGLNAIGVEPELTLSLLPNAHAVLFILSADAGVTRSDIDVWRQHIQQQGKQRGRLVALNKIDGLWDDLKSEDQVNAEIDSQVKRCAELLEISPSQVFPISAQKALLAKINGDRRLLERSRIEALEAALSSEVIPSKHAIVRDQTETELADLLGSSRALLLARRQGVDEQLNELRGLQGKNVDVVDHIMVKIAHDKEEFERGLQQFQALRSVFSQQSVILFRHLGMDTLRETVRRAREDMTNSRFTKGIREAMNRFFSDVDGHLNEATAQIEEINRMMEAMYKKLNQDHGIQLVSIPPFSMLRYRKEMERLENTYDSHFNTLLNLLTTEQYTLTSRFFETLASRVISVYETANKEVESWLKSIMSPMESQVREHQMQLRRRLESVKRIHKAADTLGGRIQELDQMRADIERQLNGLAGIDASLREALEDQPSPLSQAA